MMKTCSVSGMFFCSALAAAIWGGAFCRPLLGADPTPDDFPKITLQDQDGKQFRFYEDLLRDKIVLINLMYTRCDGTLCDRGARNLVRLQTLLGDQLGREIFLYSITLDPEHDTPDVLKEYAERYGARWSFLTGKLDDITALRYKLGLFDPDPKVDADRTQHSGMLKIGNVPLKSWSATDVLAEPKRIWEMIERTRLPTGFARQSAAQKFTAAKALLKGSGITVTINGLRTPNQWEPSSPTVKVGDVVEWHAAEGRHGVIFKDFNLAKVVLNFDTEASLTIGPQAGFPEPAQGTVAKTAPPDTLLVRATVKAIPEGVTEIPFVCTQHGDDMPGSLVLQAPPKKTSARKSAVTVTINGLVRPLRWDPKSPPVKVGDVAEWHATDGTHGVIFNDFDIAKLVLEIDTAASLPIGPQDGFPAPAQGTEAKEGPTLLVRATVKAIPAGVTEIPFLCTQHGEDMTGKLVLQAPPKTSAAKKSAPTVTINGLVRPLRWDPKSPPVKVGDVVEWHATDGTHGVIFNDFDVAKLVLEIDTAASLPIGPQDGFPAPAQGTEAKEGPTLLVRATVKAIPAGVTEIPFLCTQHDDDMEGSLVLQAPPKKAPAVRKSAPTVTINGLRTPNLRWEPNAPTVKVGDVVEWHATDGTHGVIFNDFAIAQLVLEIDTAASLPIEPQTGFPAPAQGTVAKTAPPDTLLVRATVKAIPAGLTEIPFLCTQHGDDMEGSLILQAPPKDLGSSTIVSDVESLVDLPPNVQRRLLRFVNRAYQPEDLMKSPQEVRMKSEHLPAKGDKSTSDAMAGFQPNLAVSLIARRPLNGYRDVRECLPSYRESGGLDSLRGVLDSIGPKQFGRWEEVASNLPPLMHAAMLHTGKVLFLTDSTDIVLWDPAARQSHLILVHYFQWLERIKGPCMDSFGAPLLTEGFSCPSGWWQFLHRLKI